jgi:hypothetical protein
LLRRYRNQRLLKDISELTGKDVTRVKVRRVDYRSEIALLDIFTGNKEELTFMPSLFADDKDPGKGSPSV